MKNFTIIHIFEIKLIKIIIINLINIYLKKND